MIPVEEEECVAAVVAVRPGDARHGYNHNGALIKGAFGHPPRGCSVAYDWWRSHWNTGDAGQVASSDLAMMCRVGDGFYLSSEAAHADCDQATTEETTRTMRAANERGTHNG